MGDTKSYVKNWTTGITRTDNLVIPLHYGRTNEIEKMDRSTKFCFPKELEFAVVAKGVEYSHSGTKQKVLKGVNMAVAQYSIYGLTGSSGCGKTTLISCLLGSREIDTGNIFLYGCNAKNPNKEKLIGIPGKGVGYMPQELSLYCKFSIREMMVYFGNLYGMSTLDIQEAVRKLFSLLQLPEKSTIIERLSGGEQRRVSIAISLIHSPRLLVLDEPTVGMDPLLRVRIWEYLKNLVKKKQTTVIITTHYIDEMRNADKIGIMRKGQIIAEDSPLVLQTCWNACSLNEAVLSMCKSFDETVTPYRFLECESMFEDNTMYGDQFYTHPENLSAKYPVCANINYAEVTTNSITLPLLFIFVMFIPALELLVVLLTGFEPSALRFGVVNKELNSSETNSSLQSCPVYTAESITNCDFQPLSCRFLSHISKSRLFLVNFKSDENAIAAVRKGHIYGYISFPDTFSNSMVDFAFMQLERGIYNNETFTPSGITVQLDQTNTIIYRLILTELYASQERFITSLMSACGTNPKFGEYPLQYRTPIFAKANDISINNIFGPTTAATFLFFVSILSSGLLFVEERNCGMIDRTLVSGVKVSEIIIAYLASQFFVIAIQSTLLFVVLYSFVPMDNTTCALVLNVFLILMLVGYTGLSLGFLLGSICTEQIQVGMFAVAFTVPNVILSGGLAPLESMNSYMRHIVPILPSTLTLEALRCVWNRGLGITYPQVWTGILVFIAYIAAASYFAVMFHKFRKK